ncbi:MAG: hypothetical protein K2Y17_07190 [Qipengyuania sp.]|nr:hypothetical protein [Qipengyuania sp.]
MRFQVLGSAIQYSHPLVPSSHGRVTLSFDVLPCGFGELKFSDGNRLVGCNLPETWHEPLTIGLLCQKLKEIGYKDIDEKTFWPLKTTVTVTDQDWKSVNFLNSEEFACGFADYRNDEYAVGLYIWLSVNTDAFRDLLHLRLDSPSRMFFDIGIRGLEDEDRVYTPNSLAGTWNLNDDSDCGKGELRVVTDFSVERKTSYFPRDPQSERLHAEKVEDRKEIEKLRSPLADLVAIEKGAVDGVVANLLRLNLLAISALVVIGILSLAQLYF